jgi:flagellar FliL protein
MSDAAAAPEAEAKPKKPIVLIIGGVVALVVLVAGTMVGTLFITGFFNKPVPTADQMVAEGADGGHGAPAADGHGAPKDDGHGAPAAGGHGEKKTEGGHGEKKAEGGKEGGPPKLNKKSPDSPRFEYTYSQLEREFLVNLAGSRKVMSVQIAVMTRYDDRVVENIKKHEFALRSVIMDAMRMTSEADLSKPDFRKDLAIKIRDAMNTLLEKYEDFGGIEEIYFTSFVVQ